MEDRFNVIFQGQIESGYTLEQVKQNIANLYKVPSTKLENWFSGRKITIKENIDEVTADKYKRTFERTGALCTIEPLESKNTEQLSSEKSVVQVIDKYPSQDNQQPRDDARQRQETGTNGMNSEDVIKSVVVILAMDGIIDPQEYHFLKELCHQFEVSDEVLERILEQAKQGKRNIHIPESSTERTRLLSLLVKAAAIDGKIMPQEQKALNAIAKKMNISDTDLQQLINKNMAFSQSFSSSPKDMLQIVKHPSQDEQQQPVGGMYETHDMANARRKKGVRLFYILMAMIAVLTVVGSLIGYIQYSEHRRKQQQIEEEANQLEKLELAKASYFSTGKEVVGFMIVGVLSAVEMCGEISETWSDSIKRGTDFNEAIRRKVRQLESSNGKIIQASREKVDEFMEKLDVAPKGMERHQEKMFELYGEFNKLCNQAVSPSGSLMTYNQSINNSQEKFLQLMNEVKVLYRIN